MRAVFVDVVVEGMESSSEGGWTIPSRELARSSLQGHTSSHVMIVL